MDRRRLLTGTAAAVAAGPVLAATAGTAHADPSAQAASAAGRGGRRVVPGVDALAADGWSLLAGRRVGVITNPTGVLRDLTHEVDSLAASDSVDLRAVFGPEHGFRGTGQAGDSEDTTIDPRTGVTIYNAHGATPASLADFYRRAEVDTIVFDIQDVGARFYTYIWTMYMGMQAAVATGASFIVLDRPNPIGGRAYGPQLFPGFSSAVGRKPIAQQHGMTVGELARFFDAEFLPEDAGGRLVSLEVVPVRGWRRDMVWADTGLPWVLPSPNMPTPDTALVYPGTCLFEGLTFSEGRGTTRPFEIVGAPVPTEEDPAGMDWRWAEACNAAGLDGVVFREAYFAPTFSKHRGVTCGGVSLYVTDPYRFDPIRTAVTMIVAARDTYPDVFGWRPDNFIDKLSGSARLREMVDAGASADEVVGAWRGELVAFQRQRRPYLLYR